MTMDNSSLPPGFDDMLRFGLVEALLGRRARRFFEGAEIPDGVFAYKSRSEPIPLSELEKLLASGNCVRREHELAVPSLIATIYLQAHHLDLEFYDEFFKPGAYLHTHRDHMACWHQDGVA